MSIGPGRPTLYQSKFCEELMGHMARGLSFESFAGHIGVCKQTIYSWLDQFPEFLDARKKALEKCRLFWEEQGVEGIWDVTSYENGKPSYKKSLNTGVWIFNMRNRFRDEWRNEEHPPEDPNKKAGVDELVAEFKQLKGAS